MRFCISIAALTLLAASSFAAEPNFGRDVRPILAANCYECHGPDEGARKAKMRLDQAGASVLTDGELLARITSTDPDEVMPPSDSSKSLSAEQIAMLKEWVGSGAEYEEHWAFVKPTRPKVPASGGDWARNSIDRFVSARLDVEGLKPSPTADAYTLVRRVYLDLIGLPPTTDEADAFVNSDDPQAYEKLVQQLLESDQYGERWARPWLDLARYADTNGYEKDRPRSIWPYRDWVIKALNDDMPYDQFTIEQLAGDMLPNATLEQRVATGFHRNTMLNEEGGIDPLEYRYYAMVDRVLTTGTTWLGLTTGCAQCHTHKYDPITHADYYSMFALLNNADEPDLEVVDDGTMKSRAEIDEKIAQTEQQLLAKSDAAKVTAWIAAEREKAVPWKIVKPTEMKTNLPKLTVEGDGAIFASGDFTKRDVFTLKFEVEAATALRLEVLPDERLPARGPGRSYYEGRDGDFFLSELKATAGGKAVKFASGSVDFGKIAIGSGDAKAENVYDGEGSTGWSTATREGERHELILNLAEPISAPTELKIEMTFERHFVAALGKFRVSVTNSAKSAQARPGAAVDPLAASDEAMGLEYVRFAPEFAEQRKPLDQLRAKLPKPPITLAFAERAADNPRLTHRHHRGEYLQPKEAVKPAILAVFDPLPEGQPANRLTFAKWIVSERNPLGARVAVNRAWHQFFGRGIVETTADFGTQSSLPSHPELLDWLAVEFVEMGWSMKELHRLIVTSATYRQSSKIDQQMLARDPHNELLARGPRFRLDAEVIRDVALKSSGLLSPKMFGPSVYPPQDSSVAAAAYGGTKWNVSKGEDRYRRSLYTFSKRTAPFAAFTVFDGPTGETCVARRNRSNTPLQALTMLNDEMYVEMAEALGKRAMESSNEAKARAEFVLRSCLTRPPTEQELDAVLKFQSAQSKRIKDEQLVWMLTARAVLNSDEMITKR